jgi:ATP-binding cassette subfamily F protein 3
LGVPFSRIRHIRARDFQAAPCRLLAVLSQGAMLSITDITLRVAGRTLLDGASAQIPAGARVGLVGRNGTGKTTLFRAILGELSLDAGTITMPARTRVGQVAQEAPSGPMPLIEIVLAADTERASLMAEAETAHDPDRIAAIQTRLADIEAHSAPARAAAILHGLGFDQAAQLRPASAFSGGWRMRVALAALLFTEPDLLLLDEPTNYLDLEGTLWLQDYLARYPHTVLIISHDRDLLDTCVTQILHLDQGRLTLYAGGYTSFDRQRREAQVLDQKARMKQEAERARLQKFIDRFKAKATKARQAQSRVKRLEKLVPIAGVVDDAVKPILIPAPERLPSPPILALDGVQAGYAPGAPVLRGLSLSIDTADRIALLGSNGNGKSTFAKLIAGRLSPLAGTLTRADKLKIAYFAQHQLDELNIDGTPYSHVRGLMPDAPEAKVRARTAQIGFSGEAADTPVSKLSGGEKARLMLGLATDGAPHLLILDEPTNHLDIDSRAALVDALNEFPGAVILVSHDRHLIESTADRLWLVDGGAVRAFDGDLDDYRRIVLAAPAGSAAAKDDTKASRADQRRNAAERRAELAPLRARIKTAEQTMAKLEKTLADIDAALAQPGLFERDPARGAALSKQRAEAVERLAQAEEEWLTASADHEAASA